METAAAVRPVKDLTYDEAIEQLIEAEKGEAGAEALSDLVLANPFTNLSGRRSAFRALRRWSDRRQELETLLGC